MNMPDEKEVLEIINEDNEMDHGPIFRLATVTALFPIVNTAKIKFDGEDTASGKQYSYLASYKPKINDRVIVLSFAGTYIILGKVLYNTAASTLNLSTYSMQTYQTANSTYDSTEQNMLNYIKTDLVNIITRQNAIVDFLKG